MISRVSARKRRETKLAYAIITPFYLWLTLIIVIPVICGFAFSLTEWNGIQGTPKFVGLKNFEFFFLSKDYMFLLWNQIWIGAWCLISTVVISFVIALLLNVNFGLKGFFRSAFFTPYVVSATTTAAVLVAMIDPNSGTVNNILKFLGLNPIVWSYSTFWMIFWMVVFFAWRNVGYFAVIWLGGLQSIPAQLYEAAKIDGANKLQEIRHVTIPGLREYATFIVINGIIIVMQMYDLVLLISRGAPAGTTDIIVHRIYRDGIISFNLGMSGASSVIVGIVIIGISALYLKLGQSKE